MRGSGGLPKAETLDTDVKGSGVGPIMGVTPAQETACGQITPPRNHSSTWPELGATGSNWES